MDKVTTFFKLSVKKHLSGEKIKIEDLMQFSKIKLNKKRNKKKFLKNYARYISEEIFSSYMCHLLAQPLVKSFKRMAEFNLDVIPMDENAPKGKLYYFDSKNEQTN